MMPRSGAMISETGTWSVVATVNDPDGESSGIVDASEWFGPGSWILDVQGHGVNVAEEVDRWRDLQTRVRPAALDEDPRFLISSKIAGC